VPDTLTSTVYEVRYGWTGKNIALLTGSLVFLVAPLLLSQYDTAVIDGIPVPMVVIEVLSGLLGLVGTWAVLSLLLRRTLALRVDAAGVTFGPLPFRRATGPVLVPWAEITAVELWVQQAARNTRMRYVGLHRTPGAQPLPGAGRRGGALEAANAAVVNRSAALVGSSRPVNLWQLDLPAFHAAVSAHAPELQLFVDPRFH
jgi:hypothetical protein